MLKKNVSAILTLCTMLSSCCLGVKSDMDCGAIKPQVQLQGFNEQDLERVDIFVSRRLPNTLFQLNHQTLRKVEPNSLLPLTIEPQSDLVFIIYVDNMSNPFVFDNLKVRKEICTYCNNNAKDKFEYSILDSLSLNGKMLAATPVLVVKK